MKKTILIGVSGGVAAYKVCDYINAVKKLNYDIEVIMTNHATEFISPLTLGSLIGKQVITDEFGSDGYKIKHIALAKKADLFIIIPATANIIAKISNGIADDVLTSTWLAATCAKVVAPAMNTNMYLNKVTQRNLNQLEIDGIHVIKPATGLLACGDKGIGKLAPLNHLVEASLIALHDHLLAGKKLLVNAGPTQEALDPVRFITNHSSGKMGYEIARAGLRFGMDVTLVTGPSQLPKPYGVKVVEVTTAKDMYDQMLTLSKDAEYLVLSAAVCDYKPEKYSANKIKKTIANYQLSLTKTDDILVTLGKNKTKDQVLCGFAMETENLKENAQAKFKQKNCDLLVANTINEPGQGFNSDTNKALLITKNFVEETPLITKADLSELILDKLRKIKGD